MIYVVIAEAVVILGLAGACVAITLGAIAKIGDLQDAARAERFELHERIRNPEARPTLVPIRRRRDPDAEPPPPKDLAEYAKVGHVAPPRDNENGVVS